MLSVQREGPAGPEGRGEGAGGTEGPSTGSAPIPAARPTPVRQAMDSSDSPPADATPAEASLEIDGMTVVARLAGRARVGGVSGGAPLLLIRFRREGEDAVRREALIVARDLDEITEGRLRAAYRDGRPPASGPRGPIFEEVAGRRSRGGR